MSLQRGVLLLLALSACVAAQSCSDISAISNGAKADGKTNDAAVFAAMNSKSSIGLIYMPKGTYLIGTSITISKPILADYGAIFKLSSGVTLSISNQPEHSIDTFFSGAGSGGLGLRSRRLKLHACLRSSPGHRGDTPCG